MQATKQVTKQVTDRLYLTGNSTEWGRDYYHAQERNIKKDNARRYGYDSPAAAEYAAGHARRADIAHGYTVSSCYKGKHRESARVNPAVVAYIDYAIKHSSGIVDATMIDVMANIGKIKLADGTNYGTRVIAAALVLMSNSEKYDSIEYAIRSVLYTVKRIRGFNTKRDSSYVSLTNAMELLERYQVEKRSKAKIVYGGLDRLKYTPDYTFIARDKTITRYVRNYCAGLSRTVSARLADICDARCNKDITEYIGALSTDDKQFMKRLYIDSKIDGMSYIEYSYILLKYRPKWLA